MESLQPRRPRRNPERGAMVIVMAISLGVIMGLAALVFDLAFVRLARLQMQNAADAASHAAMLKYRATQPSQSQAIAMAKGVAAANTVLGRPVTLLDSDVVFGIWDTRLYPATTFVPTTVSPNAVSVKGRISDPGASAGSVNLAFGKTLGFAQASVARSGIAAFRTRGIVICMDVTGSFTFPSADPPIYKAVAASLEFLDTMHAMNVTSDRIGMQLFTGKAHTSTPIQNLNDNYNSIRSRWEDIHICQKPGFPFWPPTGQPDDPAMPLCWELLSTPSYPYPVGPPGYYGGTNSGACLRAAGDELLASAAPYETPIIVLITDGEPMCCTHPQGGDICQKPGISPPCCESGLTCTNPTTEVPPTTNVCGCAQEKRDYGNAMADSVDADGVSIFTVSFRATPAMLAYNGGLVRGIGKAYDTPDADQLDDILKEIANSIPVTLVK